jgi:hypothetical protein
MFREFLLQRRDDPQSGGLDLLSLMITPVQRLPRYVLLLKDLLQNTPYDESFLFSFYLIFYCYFSYKSLFSLIFGYSHHLTTDKHTLITSMFHLPLMGLHT